MARRRNAQTDTKVKNCLSKLCCRSELERLRFANEVVAANPRYAADSPSTTGHRPLQLCECAYSSISFLRKLDRALRDSAYQGNCDCVQQAAAPDPGGYLPAAQDSM